MDGVIDTVVAEDAVLPTEGITPSAGGDRTKAIRDAQEARASHVAWHAWWEHEENCPDPNCRCHAEKPNHQDNNTAYEKYWIEAYDNILACLGVGEYVQNGVAEELRASVT